MIEAVFSAAQETFLIIINVETQYFCGNLDAFDIISGFSDEYKIFLGNRNLL